MPKPAFIQLTPKQQGTSKPVPPKPQRFLSLSDVLDRLTISRSLLYELIKDPVRPFPAPVHLGRRSVWVEGEVEGYMREVVEAERAAPPN